MVNFWDLAQDEDSLEEMSFVRLFSELSDDARMAIGHHFEDLVRGCTYRQTNCKNES